MFQRAAKRRYRWRAARFLPAALPLPLIVDAMSSLATP
jgi:hypothetical protein